MKYTLSDFGELEFKGDHWSADEIETEVGLVDVQVDAEADLEERITESIGKVLAQIANIDQLGRSYLKQKIAPELDEIKLVEPSLLFVADLPSGSFTLFYSNENRNDETCYGIEFRDYSPFDLTIGD
jgi:hypothetical protein